MSLHVEYFKWIQRPRVVCGLFLAVKPSTHPLHSLLTVAFPGLLIISSVTLHHPRPVHFQFFCAAEWQHCFLCSLQLPLCFDLPLDTQILTQTPLHPAPTRWWQDCSDRKRSLDKTEASCVFLNSSQMLIGRVSPLRSPFLSLVKERPDVSCVFKRLGHSEFSTNTSGC